MPGTRNVEIDDDTAFSYLAFFDTVFILDNTGSMQVPAGQQDEYRSRWDLLEEALKSVVQKTIDNDKDGVDVYFLKGGRDYGLNIEHVDQVPAIEEKLEEARRLLSTPQSAGGTYFKESLKLAIDQRLTDHRKYIVGRRKNPQLQQPKALNLIVVTDGAADDPILVKQYLRETAEELDYMEALPAYIGIQFVQVGDDPGATQWLNELDDNLSQEPNSKLRDVSIALSPSGFRLIYWRTQD